MSTRRLLSALLCTSLVCAQDVSAQSIDWVGPPTGTGDWFDPLNWSGGVVPNDDGAIAWIYNGGTARLSDGASAVVNAVRIGHDNDWTPDTSGRLEIDHAALQTNGFTIARNGSLYLNHATLTPLQWYDPDFNLSDNASVEIGSGSHGFRYFYFANSEAGEKATVTINDGADVQLRALFGSRSGNGELTQLGGSVQFTHELEIGWDDDFQFVYNIHAGTLAAPNALIGNSSDSNTGVLNQHGGAIDFTNLNLGETGTYNRFGGTLHIEKVLTGKGVMDFQNQAATVTLGDSALLNLSDLTVLNSQQVTVSGGQNGVLRIGANDNPDDWFGSFDFGGFVIRGNETINIAADQDVVLAGPVNNELNIDGAVRALDTPVTLMGQTTIRGTLDINSGQGTFDESVMIVNGHTSRLESGYGRFNAIVGDGSSSRLKLEGGEFAGANIVIRGTPGDLSEVIFDGATTTTPFSLQMSSYSSNNSRTIFKQLGGEVTIGRYFELGRITLLHVPEGIELNTPYQIGGSSNKIILDEGGVMNVQSGTDMRIGSQWGGGTFEHINGTVNASSSSLILSYSEGYTSNYIMDEGSLNINEILVGRRGTGNFYHNGGSVMVGGDLEIGHYLRSDGYYQLNDGSLQAGRVLVGNQGQGIFEQLGGSLTTSELILGFDTDPDDTAEFQLRGGNLQADQLAIGTYVNQSYSTATEYIQTGGVADFGKVAVGRDSPMTLSGGTINIHRSLNSGFGTINFGDGDATLNILEGANANFAQGSILGGSNASFAAQANTLVVLPSDFDISQFGSFTSLGLVQRDGEALIIPVGTTITSVGLEVINGGVVNNGVLAPGSSPGRLAINGDLVQSASAELEIEIGGTKVNEFDQLNVWENATLDGMISLSLYEGFVPNLGDSFTIIEASGMEGHFSSVQGVQGQPGLASVAGLAVTYDYELDTVSVTAALLGDANLDGMVDSDDFNLLAFNYDGTDATWADGDFTGDGVVGSDDFNLLAFNFGANAALTQSDYAAVEAFASRVAVPEPGSLSLLGLASLLLIHRRRSR